MVLVAVGERQPECRHIIPMVHRQVLMRFWLAPVTIFEGPRTTSQPKWATALPEANVCSRSAELTLVHWLIQLTIGVD
ncbi:hypothetical protein PpBr36_00925 [Pyricularia pennisetigena]|uniref:hypothetical protein n=1 Tax=Pyricularia pennisetigena TaxID=1578925 RepID=UPI00114FB5D5|nr:hypothetical protein PpBr36_00925 [Pyricularia pennisetigena]TLS29271.1 hypothetical protein PpBr36_00925 [Pyricularia pennisetigena]